MGAFKPAERAADGVNRAAITVCVILATLMQALDTTIANVALPYMQGSVSASQDQIDLGADLVYRRCRDHDAADRLPRRAVRAQTPFPRLHRRLHRRLDALRHGTVLGRDRAVPGAARLVWRRARPALSDRAAQHQSEGAAGIRNGAMGRRGDGRSRSWAGARRLADRGL